MIMKPQAQFVALQSKNVHFGEPCESGYSTTTSSEEGTLQRGFTQTRHTEFESESFLQNPKFLQMISKGIAVEEARTKRITSRQHKKRTKINYLESPDSPSSQGSPFSSTSSLTQQYGIPHHMPAHHASSHESVKDKTSLDEMTSSFEHLGLTAEKHNYVSEDDIVKSAAIQQFQKSMNKVKVYQNECVTDLDAENFRRDLEYYKVGPDSNNSYYDPLDISDVACVQSRRRVVISTSPSCSSGEASPTKHPHVRSILKKPASQHPHIYSSSTPTWRGSLQNSQNFSTSEENLTSIKNITPPGQLSPLSPEDRKSAFVVVKPRAVNRLPEAPVSSVHPPVQHNMGGYELYNGHGNGSSCHHTCCPGVNDKTLQSQMTPRNRVQVARPTTLEYKPITDQFTLQSPYGGQRVSGSIGSPKDGNIVFIPAQIDDRGIPQPVRGGFHANSLQGFCGNHHHPENSQVNHDQSRHYDDTLQVATENLHKRNGSHGNSHENRREKTPESPLPPAEVLSNEAVRLRQFVDKADPEALKKRLEKLLKSKDPGSIHALAKLFPGSEFTAEAAHCVRCHKDFNPREPGRCILPHPERMVAKISQDSIGADFVCGCCNESFRLIKMDFYEESTNALLTGHCYSGTHTTDPDSVDYRIDGGSAKSCEEFGCIEFYV